MPMVKQSTRIEVIGIKRLMEGKQQILSHCVHHKLACDELIMKIVPSLFIHRLYILHINIIHV
jgi:hypothetical protein